MTFTETPCADCGHIHHLAGHCKEEFCNCQAYAEMKKEDVYTTEDEKSEVDEEQEMDKRPGTKAKKK
jgi:hypothetical protein